MLSPRYALGAQHFVICAGFVLFFLYLNYIPLWHTDLWCHVAYGQWILDHGQLPTEDPFMPLAEGMRVIDTTWLGQVIFASLESWGGPQWLSNLYAIVVLATYLILTRVFYVRTRSLALSVLGALLTLAIGWSRHAIIRTEVFGFLSFAVLLWLLLPVVSFGAENRSHATERVTWPRHLWLATAVLFALWANLHGSFLCGFAVLGCFTLGRAVGVGWSARNPLAALRDARFQRWLLLSELAVGATLINPYGMDLLIHNVLFPRNANLRDIMEWYPLTLLSPTGYAFMLSIVLLFVLFRHSRYPIRPAEILLLGIFAAAVVSGIRMIGWYAVVVAFLVMPHCSSVLGRLQAALSATQCRSTPERSARDTRSFRYTGLCLLAVWIGFALSGLGLTVLGGKPRSDEQLYSRYTPLELTKYLRENPPSGQVWNPQVWGDWLVQHGPPRMKVFMTTMVHLSPRRVWRDYMRVASGLSGWEEVLDRYAVTTVIVDKELQSALATAIRRSSQWKVAYEDKEAIVLVRATNAPSEADPASPGKVAVRTES